MAEVKLPENPKWLLAMCRIFPDEILEHSKISGPCKALKEKLEREKIAPGTK